MSRKSKAEYIGEKRRAYACASAARYSTSSRSSARGSQHAPAEPRRPLHLPKSTSPLFYRDQVIITSQKNVKLQHSSGLRCSPDISGQVDAREKWFSHENPLYGVPQTIVPVAGKGTLPKWSPPNRRISPQLTDDFIYIDISCEHRSIQAPWKSLAALCHHNATNDQTPVPTVKKKPS